MPDEDAESGGPISSLDLRSILPFEPAAASGQLEGEGLAAARFHETPAFELDRVVLQHHMLALFARPPKALEVQFQGVKRYLPPAAGSIMLVPAGSPVRARSSGQKDELHVFVAPGVVEQVAAEAFDLDPARMTVPPLDGLDLPHLRAAMGAVDAELSAGGTGGRLAAESLANVVAVQLLRQILAPRGTTRGKDGALPRAKLRTVLDYVEEHLEGSVTLEQMAAAVHLSAYHFARQFKAATGMPPHRYIVSRRIARAQELLQPDVDLSLAEIAARTGFSDQSQLSHHFKRALGVTPGQFRSSARIS
jgi:AraC family transcriptional regulator